MKKQIGDQAAEFEGSRDAHPGARDARSTCDEILDELQDRLRPAGTMAKAFDWSPAMSARETSLAQAARPPSTSTQLASQRISHTRPVAADQPLNRVPSGSAGG
jgi:hypothetical protein